ncbi:MAG TPA: hypothetical protein VMC84_12330 [Methanocella sp.]|nr:hypothetical protein [Methanocella sp.]
MKSAIAEGRNIGKIMGYYDAQPLSGLGKVIVQIGNEVVILDYPLPDGEYELIKSEYPLDSLVIIKLQDGDPYIERSTTPEV